MLTVVTNLNLIVRGEQWTIALAASRRKDRVHVCFLPLADGWPSDGFAAHVLRKEVPSVVREATELSLKIPAGFLAYLYLRHAVHEKEKEGDIACCLSSVHVRVGFDMFGSVIGGGRIGSSHRINLLPCFGWLAWRQGFVLSFVEYLFSLYFACLLHM